MGRCWLLLRDHNSVSLPLPQTTTFAPQYDTKGASADGDDEDGEGGGDGGAAKPGRPGKPGQEKEETFYDSGGVSFLCKR